VKYSMSIFLNTKHDEINIYVNENATIYHLTDWMVLIHKVFGHNGYYLYVTDESGSICGVLPLIHMSSRLFGSFLVSIPYFNYGGIVADSIEIETMLLDKAIDLAKQLDVKHLELREGKAREQIKHVRTDKVNMILNLPDNILDLEKTLGSKLRAQIKRSMREGFEVSQGGLDRLDDFYKVFSENMRDLGTPVYSKCFFKELLHTFPLQTSIIILKLAGVPVSAAFLIRGHKKLEIPWASSLRKYNKFSPNMLLYWSVLQFAINKGCKQFDFGRSTIDSGTYKFKKQWGALPVQLYWNYWLSKGGSMPKLNPDNPKYKLAINMWKKLPLIVANFIGPTIVKNLP
jgi:serine/alanine adding enzyme